MVDSVVAGTFFVNLSSPAIDGDEPRRLARTIFYVGCTTSVLLLGLSTPSGTNNLNPNFSSCHPIQSKEVSIDGLSL